MTVRTWLPAGLLAVTLATGTLGAPVAASATPGSAKTPSVSTQTGATGDVTDRYLVRYAPGTDIAAQARGLRSQGVEVRRTFGHAVKAAAVTINPAQAAALARSPKVEAVEVDAPVQVTSTQDNAPWGLDRTDQRDLPLSKTYTAAGSGAGVDVYVVDTGVRADHVDFGGRVAAGWTAIQDGRGTGDCNGHGTHVAGTVAGTTYGAAKSARVIPVRVLDCNGSGYISGIVAGLDWVAAQHAAGTPAVVNMSLGAGASSTLDAAVNGVIADGVTAVAAAGNSTADACNFSPARVPGALTIAASSSSDTQASFSNYGRCVDLYAPGVSVLSAWHDSTTAKNWLQGTSMAAPHVAGAAAVLLSQDPTRTPATVSELLTTGATTGKIAQATTGTPNRLLHLAAPAQPVVTEPEPVVTEPEPVVTPPSKAKRPRAKARTRGARLTWVRGADGGAPVTRQTLVLYKGSQKVRRIGVSGTTTALTVRRLRPNAPYSFRVIQRNEVGSSGASARSNRVRPLR